MDPQILISQYRATLQMLRDCIALCPDDAWAAGDHPRAFWRIAYHALYYTHLYLMPRAEDFIPWVHDVPHARILWLDDEEGVPPVETTYTQAQLLQYLDWLAAEIPTMVNQLDLTSPDSGIPWYRKISKLEHQWMNVRHLGTHVGQLQERLFPLDLDPEWVSKSQAESPLKDSL